MQALLRERLFYVITPAIKYPHSIGLYSRSNNIKICHFLAPVGATEKYGNYSFGNFLRFCKRFAVI